MCLRCVHPASLESIAIRVTAWWDSLDQSVKQVGACATESIYFKLNPSASSKFSVLFLPCSLLSDIDECLHA